MMSHSLCLSNLTGSEEERIAVETASRYGSKPEVYSSSVTEDVDIQVSMDGEGPRMGGDAELSIILRNTSSKVRTLTLHSQVYVMYYTGILRASVKKDETPVVLAPAEGEHRAITAPGLGYRRRFGSKPEPRWPPVLIMVWHFKQVYPVRKNVFDCSHVVNMILK